MLSIIPIHKLKASFQFEEVKKAAAVIEKSGGVVVGSITDNNKVNQHYCTMFSENRGHKAAHPLDESKEWYLLFDTVHLFKSIRNNWYSEKSKNCPLMAQL